MNRICKFCNSNRDTGHYSHEHICGLCRKVGLHATPDCDKPPETDEIIVLLFFKEERDLRVICDISPAEKNPKLKLISPLIKGATDKIVEDRTTDYIFREYDTSDLLDAEELIYKSFDIESMIRSEFIIPTDTKIIYMKNLYENFNENKISGRFVFPIYIDSSSISAKIKNKVIMNKKRLRDLLNNTLSDKSYKIKFGYKTYLNRTLDHWKNVVNYIESL